MPPPNNRKHSFLSAGLTKRIFSFVLPAGLLIAFLGYQFFCLVNTDWSSGFNHPFEGWDHLVTMLAVGIWAAQMRGRAVWLLPLAFVSVMSLGGLAGAAGITIPSTEGIILLSGAVFSILITRKMRFSNKVNVLIVAFFAFFHGFAHGQEISTSASLVSYTFGFMLATLLLHGAGILVAKIIVLTVTFFFSLFFTGVSQAQSPLNPNSTFTSFATPDMLKYAHPNLALKSTHGFSGIYDDISVTHKNSLVNDVLELSHKLTLPDEPNFNAGKLNSENSNKFAVFAVDFPLQAIAAIANNTSQDSHFHWYQFQAQHIDADPCYLLIKPLNLLQLGKNLISFIHYYPDINNTPGTSLLTNGVGLTSPPTTLSYPSLTVQNLSSNTPAPRNCSHPKILHYPKIITTFDAHEFWAPRSIPDSFRFIPQLTSNYLISAFTCSKTPLSNRLRGLNLKQSVASKIKQPLFAYTLYQHCIANHFDSAKLSAAFALIYHITPYLKVLVFAVEKPPPNFATPHSI